MNPLNSSITPVRHPVFRWLERAAEHPRLNGQTGANPHTQTAPVPSKPSLVEAYPDLVDKVTRRFPEAKAYLREVIEEWWAINRPGEI